MTTIIDPTYIVKYDTIQDAIASILVSEIKFQDGSTIPDDRILNIFPDKDFSALDSGLYIMILIENDLYNNVTKKGRFDSIAQEYYEDISIYRKSVVSIEMFSKNNEAFLTHYKIPVALNSPYADRIKSKNSIGFSKNPTGFSNISDFSISNSSIIFNRFKYTYIVDSEFTVSKNTDYYDALNISSGIYQK